MAGRRRDTLEIFSERKKLLEEMEEQSRSSYSSDGESQVSKTVVRRLYFRPTKSGKELPIHRQW